jgi:hypothetical protein
MSSENRLAEIKARRAVADLPWEVKTDTPDGPVIHDAYNEVARIEVPHAVWECDDELDGCPDARRESIRRAKFIANAPADIDWLVGDWKDALAEVRRLRDLLGRLEWVSPDMGSDFCPACGTHGHPGLRHAPGCWLAAELEPEPGRLSELAESGGGELPHGGAVGG